MFIVSKPIKRQVADLGGFDNLRSTTADIHDPKEGERLVKINTASLSHRETERLLAHPLTSSMRPQIDDQSDAIVTPNLSPILKLPSYPLENLRHYRFVKTLGGRILIPALRFCCLVWPLRKVW